MTFLSLPSARWWAGAMTALLAGGWFAPAAARAGCGDYVTIPGETRSHSTPDTGEPSPSVSGHRLPQPFAPCASVSCLPPVDMALAGAPVSGEIDQWALPNLLPLFLRTEHESVPVAENIHSLQGSDTSIFHPPRMCMG
jgi:hypothetical protein